MEKRARKRTSESRGLVGASLLALSACTASCRYPATAILVRVQTDLAWEGAQPSLTEVQLWVWNRAVSRDMPPEGIVNNQTLTLGRGSGRYVLPGTFVLSHPSGTASATSVLVVGLNGGREVVRTRAVVSFVDRRTQLLDLYLASRCIREAATCAPDQTCGRFGCEAIQRNNLPTVDPNDAGELTALDGPAMDATQDGPTDAASESQPETAAGDATSDGSTSLDADASAMDALESALGEASSEGAAADAGSDTAASEGSSMDALEAAVVPPDAGLDASSEPPAGEVSSGDAPFSDASLGEVASADAPPESGTSAGPNTQPRWPPSGAMLTTQSPTLQWVVGTSDVAPAAVQLCRDRALTLGCASLIVSATGAVTSGLAPGAWFWRMQGLARGPLQPVWEFFVPARGALNASQQGLVADFNGDGLADVAVGSPFAGASGSAFVYYGRSGLPSAVDLTIADPAGTASQFGRVVAAAGDVDGDGFGDLAVGAPGDGSVWLYRGGPSGLSATPWVTLRGTSPGATGFGQSIAGGGDWNGDGYADLAVGAPGDRVNRGSVSLFPGGPLGPASAPAQVLLGATSSEQFGSYLVSAGDFDADGFAELVVGIPGSPPAGSVAVFQGSAAGLGAAPRYRLDRAAEMIAAFGEAVATLGDVDGDGFPDLGVLSQGPMGMRALLSVYRGSDSSVGSGPPQSIDLPGGSALGPAGDDNGDGLADVVVGDWRGSGMGRVYLLRGSAAGPAAPLSLLDGASDDAFGSVLGGGADLDGDGRSEFLAGAPQGPGGAGAVYLYSGPTLRRVLASPLPGAVHFGWTVASRNERRLWLPL